jgi:hypothetical protein
MRCPPKALSFFRQILNRVARTGEFIAMLRATGLKYVWRAVIVIGCLVATAEALSQSADVAATPDAVFDPTNGFIDLPGSATKFTIRRDPRTETAGAKPVWWMLSNAAPPAVVVSRTAFDDAEGGARNYHDANSLTFHRVKDFRSRSMADSCVDPKSLGW